MEKLVEPQMTFSFWPNGVKGDLKEEEVIYYES